MDFPEEWEEEEKHEKGKRELEDLKTMVVAWKESYLRLPRKQQGIYLSKELHDEIDEFMGPYLVRLMATEFITPEQLQEFLQFCEGQLMELQKEMEKVELEDMMEES